MASIGVLLLGILLHYIEEAEGNEGVESVKLRKNQGFEKKKRKSEKRC